MKHILLYNQRSRPLVVSRENAMFKTFLFRTGGSTPHSTTTHWSPPGTSIHWKHAALQLDWMPPLSSWTSFWSWRHSSSVGSGQIHHTQIQMIQSSTSGVSHRHDSSFPKQKLHSSDFFPKKHLLWRRVVTTLTQGASFESECECCLLLHQSNTSCSTLLQRQTRSPNSDCTEINR